MKVHLVDGTYELFRAYYGAPSARAPDGREVGATRAFLRSMLALLASEEVTHVAVAFDTVIESFRNELFAGYKTGAGIEAELHAQFPLVEEAASALGLVVWRMIDFEADDALATGAARFAGDPGVTQVVLCSPDKDLAQCVRDAGPDAQPDATPGARARARSKAPSSTQPGAQPGAQIVCWDRLRNKFLDHEGVMAKFGVAPRSIPDYLGLVGDTADGIPGVPRWGAKSAAAILARYGHLEAIPDRESEWDVNVRGRAQLAETLRAHREEARLYRLLATLRSDVPMTEELGDLEWRGARRQELGDLCARVGDRTLQDRISRWRD